MLADHLRCLSPKERGNCSGVGQTSGLPVHGVSDSVFLLALEPEQSRRGQPHWPRYELAGAPDMRESGLASPTPQRRGALSLVARGVWRPRFVTKRPIVLPLSWGEGRGEVALKAEARRPKEGRVPKSEDRNPVPRAIRVSAFGFAPLPPSRLGSNSGGQRCPACRRRSHLPLRPFRPRCQNPVANRRPACEVFYENDNL